MQKKLSWIILFTLLLTGCAQASTDITKENTYKEALALIESINDRIERLEPLSDKERQIFQRQIHHYFNSNLSDEEREFYKVFHSLYSNYEMYLQGVQLGNEEWKFNYHLAYLDDLKILKEKFGFSIK